MLHDLSHIHTCERWTHMYQYPVIHILLPQETTIFWMSSWEIPVSSTFPTNCFFKLPDIEFKGANSSEKGKHVTSLNHLVMGLIDRQNLSYRGRNSDVLGRMVGCINGIWQWFTYIYIVIQWPRIWYGCVWECWIYWFTHTRCVYFECDYYAFRVYKLLHLL